MQLGTVTDLNHTCDPAESGEFLLTDTLGDGVLVADHDTGCERLPNQRTILDLVGADELPVLWRIRLGLDLCSGEDYVVFALR